MAPSEISSITELTDEVKGLRADLRVILTKLFGSDMEENSQGRIPRLEAQSANHEERISALEALRQRAGGAGWIAAALLAAIDLAFRAVVIVKGH